MRMLSLRRATRDEGASLVEFALVAVLLIVVFLSMVEMGRMILVYTTLANSAKAGARYAMVHGGLRTGTGVDGPSGPTCPCTQVVTVVKNYARAGLVNISNVNVNVSYPDATGNAVGSTVDVTVSYTYDPMMGYFSSILNKTLSSTSEAKITF